MGNCFSCSGHMKKKIGRTHGLQCCSQVLSHCRLWFACLSFVHFSPHSFYGVQYLGYGCLGPERTWVCTFPNLPFFFPLTSGGPVISWSKNNHLDGWKFPWLPAMTLLYLPHSFWGVSFPYTEGWGGQKGWAALHPISHDHMESLWRHSHGMTGQNCGWPASVVGLG